MNFMEQNEKDAARMQDTTLPMWERYGYKSQEDYESSLRRD